jgi:hypothetical protein
LPLQQGFYRDSLVYLMGLLLLVAWVLDGTIHLYEVCIVWARSRFHTVAFSQKAPCFAFPLKYMEAYCFACIERVHIYIALNDEWL